MSIYNTKQRRALLAFLGEHPDELLTARQMADALQRNKSASAPSIETLHSWRRKKRCAAAQKVGRTKRFISILTPRAARARCT